MSVTYNNAVLHPPFCAAPLCSIGEFQAGVAEVLPSDYAALCAASAAEWNGARAAQRRWVRDAAAAASGGRALG